MSGRHQIFNNMRFVAALQFLHKSFWGLLLNDKIQKFSASFFSWHWWHDVFNNTLAAIYPSQQFSKVSWFKFFNKKAHISTQVWDRQFCICKKHLFRSQDEITEKYIENKSKVTMIYLIWLHFKAIEYYIVWTILTHNIKIWKKRSMEQTPIRGTGLILFVLYLHHFSLSLTCILTLSFYNFFQKGRICLPHLPLQETKMKSGVM